MSGVLPFTLLDRWIVTVESERQLVKVRHRTRWYAVARRRGHEDRAYRCATRQDALGIAEILREGFDKIVAVESDPGFRQFRAWFMQQSPDRQAELRNAGAVPIST